MLGNYFKKKKKAHFSQIRTCLQKILRGFPLLYNEKFCARIPYPLQRLLMLYDVIAVLSRFTSEVRKTDSSIRRELSRITGAHNVLFLKVFKQDATLCAHLFIKKTTDIESSVVSLLFKSFSREEHTEYIQTRTYWTGSTTQNYQEQDTTKSTPKKRTMSVPTIKRMRLRLSAITKTKSPFVFHAHPHSYLFDMNVVFVCIEIDTANVNLKHGFSNDTRTTC